MGAVDPVRDRSVVLFDLGLPCIVLSTCKEVLEVVECDLPLAPTRRVEVFVRYCGAKERYDLAVDALRTRHGPVDDAQLGRRRGLHLQTEPALEVHV